MAPVARSLAAPRSFADWALSGVGFSAATASAGFAAYMIVLSPKEVASGDFRVFAQFDHRYRSGPDGSGTAMPASGPATADPAPADPRTAQAESIDFTPTGTIPTPGNVSQSGAGSVSSGASRHDLDGVPLPGFTVRDVFDGHALVESRSSLSVVKPGSVLDGAGQVLSIERHGDRWVVRTDKGLIAAGRR